MVTRYAAENPAHGEQSSTPADEEGDAPESVAAESVRISLVFSEIVCQMITSFGKYAEIETRRPRRQRQLVRHDLDCTSRGLPLRPSYPGS
jgi:hypothetical protein